MMEWIGGRSIDAKLRELAEKLGGNATVKVGFMSNATYPDGQSVAMVAALNEYGVPARGQLPRPFFRDMIADKKGSWPAGVATQLEATNYDVRATLDRVGQSIKGQLQDSIRNFDRVPLAPSTIARKGNEKQLIDTGHMLDSVESIVEGE